MQYNANISLGLITISPACLLIISNSFGERIGGAVVISKSLMGLLPIVLMVGVKSDVLRCSDFTDNTQGGNKNVRYDVLDVECFI